MPASGRESRTDRAERRNGNAQEGTSEHKGLEGVLRARGLWESSCVSGLAVVVVTVLCFRLTDAVGSSAQRDRTRRRWFNREAVSKRGREGGEGEGSSRSSCTLVVEVVWRDESGEERAKQEEEGNPTLASKRSRRDPNGDHETTTQE